MLRKQRARFVAISLLLVAAIVVFAACAGPAQPTPTTGPTTTAPTTIAPTSSPSPTSPSPAATLKPIELKFSTWSVSGHVVSLLVQRMADEIESRSAGRINITVYLVDSLGAGKDQYDMARTGIADITSVVPNYTAGRFPLSTIIELPFANPGSLIASKVFWELGKKGYFDQEFGDVKVLSLETADPYQLYMTKKKPMSLADLRGMKFRTPGGMITETLKLAGIVPVSMPGAEMYTSMERGIVDGTAIAYSTTANYRLQEITKYVAEVNMAATAVLFAMNKDSWAKLPKDLQDIIAGVGADAVVWAGESWDREAVNSKEVMRQAEVELYTFPEREKWVALSKGIWDNWGTEMDAKGFRGTQLKNDLNSMLGQFGVKPPF